VPSHSFDTWNTARRQKLDEIAAAHSAVGGTARGRRYATQQINQAYVVLLSSQFQAFCRDLHTEAALHFVAPLPSQAYRDIVYEHFVQARRLDHGNPNPGNLGSDFGRFGFSFWDRMRGNPERQRVVDDQALLEDLNVWRNAIAHQDFTQPAFLRRFPGRSSVHLAEVRRWRRACERLATRMDTVLADLVQQLAGTRPW